MDAMPRIETVQPLENLRLLVRFRSGDLKIYDCAQLLSRPQFQKLTEPGFFTAVHVDAGGYGVSWNDEIDLSEYELWTNGVSVAEDVSPASNPASHP